VTDSLEEIQWSFNDNWRDYFDNNVDLNNWKWDTYWKYIKSISHNRCTTFDTNSKLTQFVKLSNNLMPTIDNLRIRNDFYNLIPCPFCHQDNETLLHLTICPETDESYAIIEKEVVTKLLKNIMKLKPKCIPSHAELEKIIFEYKDDAFLLLKERTRKEFMRGLVSSTIVNKLKKLISRKATNLLTIKIIKHFHTSFHKHIWIPRCIKLVTIEQQAGITWAQKRLSSGATNYTLSQTQTNHQ
jgi:hypothetical protein